MAEDGKGASQKEAKTVSAISLWDRFFVWSEGLPVPVWVFYVGVYVCLELVLHLTFWIDGSAAWGTYVRVPSVSPPLLTLAIGFYHYLTHAARRALENFRPLLEVDEGELAELEARLTVLPVRMFWIAFGISAVGSVAYMSYTENLYGTYSPRTALPMVAVYAISVWVAALFYGLLFRGVRQFQIVIDLHRRVSEIDLIHLRPTLSFARLTAGTGSGLILILVAGYLYNPDLISEGNMWGMGVSVGVALALFVGPLAGLRRRLMREKIARLDEINGRLSAAVARVNGMIERGEDKGILEANTAVGALVRERELIEKVSTWPWDTSTLRGFVSTIGLPVVIWFITRFLGQYF